MARALEAILKELDSVYSPQRDVYNQQIKALPGQQNAELAGLESAKEDSFGQIVQGANRRGVAFGGIPLEEQSKYLGSSYLPAVANLKNRFQQNKFNLQDALAQIFQTQRQDAYSIYDQELARDEAARARASSASAGSGFNFNQPAVKGDTLTPQQSALQDANSLRTQYFQSGNIGGATTFAREAALEALRNKYQGQLNDKQLMDIIYKQIFPDDWASQGSTQGSPFISGGGGGGGGGGTW